jgi:SAM-dependent methyltransferase
MSGMREYYEGSAEYREMLAGQDPDVFRDYVELYAAFAARDAPVLDVGCGIGASTLLLRERGYDAIGTDISARFLPQGLEGFLVVDFEQADSLASGAYAAAGAFNVLEHVERPRRFLTELVRTVRPGGHVILLSPNLASPLAAVRVLLDQLRGETPYLGITSRRAALRLLGANLARSLAAAAGRTSFSMRAPATATGIVGHDADAVYWTNAPEVRRTLSELGCDIEAYQGRGRTRFARTLARAIPPFAGQLCVVARKRGTPSPV